MIKVQVRHPFQICHEGTVYGPGDMADVPETAAQQWIRSGWVELDERDDEQRLRHAPNRRSR